VPAGSGDDPSVDQWYFACSRGGQRMYPYGDTFKASACRGPGAIESARAGGMPACVGGYEGVFDLSGNVWEWEDHCDGDRCANRGGAWGHTELALSCPFASVGYYQDRDIARADTGFRCCGD
jgi:formylglycine-generating enzyme required for sulfatase activity